MNGSWTNWKILPSPSEKNLPLTKYHLVYFDNYLMGCFSIFQAMSIHQSPIPTILQVQVRKKKKIKEIKKKEQK